MIQLFVLVLLSIASIASGSYLLHSALMDDAPFLVFPDVFRYQGYLSLIVFGIVMLISGGYLLNKKIKTLRLQRTYPKEPWMWNLGWSKRLSYSDRRAQPLPTFFAIAWTIGVSPIALSSLSLPREEMPFVVTSLAFAVVGVATAFYAMYTWWKYFSVDNTPLHLLTNPGNTGAEFACELAIPKVSKSTRWHAEMVCVYSYIETKKHRRKYRTERLTDVLWRESISPSLERSFKGAKLAMHFNIGSGYPPSGAYQKGKVDWYVNVVGKSRSGKQIHNQVYRIPVLPGADASLIEDHASTLSLPEAKERGVDISPSGINYTDQVWLNRKERRSAEIAVLVSAIVGGLSLFLFFFFTIEKQDLRGVPALIIGLASLTVLLVYARSAYHQYSVSFSASGITRENRLLFRRWNNTIPWEQVRTITWRRAGKANKDIEHSHYRQVVVNPDDKKMCFTMSPSIYDYQLVDTLVEFLKNAKVHYSSPGPRDQVAESEEPEMLELEDL